MIEKKKKYKHIKSGEFYEIILFSNLGCQLNKSFKPTVVYKDNYGEIYSRPIQDFIEKFEPA